MKQPANKTRIVVIKDPASSSPQMMEVARAAADLTTQPGASFRMEIAVLD